MFYRVIADYLLYDQRQVPGMQGEHGVPEMVITWNTRKRGRGEHGVHGMHYGSTEYVEWSEHRAPLRLGEHGASEW